MIKYKSKSLSQIMNIFTSLLKREREFLVVDMEEKRRLFVRIEKDRKKVE